MKSKHLPRRLLTGVLSLLIGFTMLPLTAFAADGKSNPYDIKSENQITVTAIEESSETLNAIKAEAKSRQYGAYWDSTAQPFGAMAYGEIVSPFSLSSEEPIVTVTMEEPDPFSDVTDETEKLILKKTFADGYKFKLAVQSGDKVVFYPVSNEETDRLKVTFPVRGTDVTCALVLLNPYTSGVSEGNYAFYESIQNNEPAFSLDGNTVHYEWKFQFSDTAANAIAYTSNAASLGYYIDPGAGLTLVDGSLKFTTGDDASDGLFQVTGSEGNYIVLSEPVTGTANQNKLYEALKKPLTITFDAELQEVPSAGQVIPCPVIEIIASAHQITQRGISSTAPLVQQRVIGIKYVDATTNEEVGTGTTLAGMDDTTIPVEGLTAPQGYELALDEGETAVAIDNNVATVPVKMKVFTIEAVAGPNGSISPAGDVTVQAGEDQTFTFKPNSGYEVNTVLVDGTSVGAVDSYTFEDVIADHTIVVTFEEKSSPPIIVVPPDDDDDDQPEDPDDTGVSDLLNTKDHDQYLFGYPDGTFGPGLNMTRAEAAQMFYNLLLDQDVEITKTFEDVPEDAWYAKAVNTLASLDIISGVGDNKFEPNRSITRAEFTTIAMRFTKGAMDGENIFPDVDADDWFYDYVVGSIQYGWIHGYPDGTFRPNNPITRAEVTAIVNNMLGREADEDFVDEHAEELTQFSDIEKHWAYYHIAEATNDHDYTQPSSGENWTRLN